MWHKLFASKEFGPGVLDRGPMCVSPHTSPADLGYPTARPHILPTLSVELLASVDGVVRGISRGWARIGMDADDLAQSCRVKLIERHADYDPARGSFKTWARMISNSECRRLWRLHQQDAKPLGMLGYRVRFASRASAASPSMRVCRVSHSGSSFASFTIRAVISKWRNVI